MLSLKRAPVFVLAIAAGACTDQGQRGPIGPEATHPSFYESGISGRSGAPSAGLCSDCHDPDNGAAAPTVTLSGPTTVNAGETGSYTLTISPASGSNQSQGGLNVAVPSGGSLTAGGGTKVSSGEIVQTQAKSGTGDLSWSFQWQAPATGGTHTMYAVGLSTDGSGKNGDEQGTDALAITVQAANNPPTSDPKTVTADVNASAPITLRGSDAETCELSFTIVNGPANGSLSSISDGTCSGSGPYTDAAAVTYTPDNNYSGPDEFTYRVTDQGGLSSDAVVDIEVLDPSAVDYKLLRLRVKRDKSNKLVATFIIKNMRNREQAPVQAELYVDDPDGIGNPVCTMMVSDAPGGRSMAHTFAPPNCDFALDKRTPPTTYEVTVKLSDDAPDSMTKTLSVRRFAKILGILGIIGDALRSGGG
jgi:hypothetical protein